MLTNRDEEVLMQSIIENKVLRICAHCGRAISSSFYKVRYDEEGIPHYYHHDLVMGKNCVVAAGISEKMVQYPHPPNSEL